MPNLRNTTQQPSDDRALASTDPDLVQIDKLAMSITPDRQAFIEAMRQVVNTRTRSSYIRLAATALAAARMLPQPYSTPPRPKRAPTELRSVAPPPRTPTRLAPDWKSILKP